MSLHGKAKYTLSLMSISVGVLKKIMEDRDSPTSLIANISSETALVIISDIEALANSFSKFVNADVFNENKMDGRDEFYVIWSKYIDFICSVMRKIIISPEILHRFNSSERTFIYYCTILFSQFQQKTYINDEIVDFSTWDNYKLFDDMVSDLILTEEHFYDLVDSAQRTSYFSEFERVSSATTNKLHSLMENKISEVDKTIGNIKGSLSDEKKKLGDKLSKFDSSASDLLSFYSERLSAIEKTEEDIQKLFGRAIDRADGILKLASQEGMASAFQKRHDDLKWPEIRWLTLFAFALIGLTVFGVWFVETVFSTKGIDFAEVVSRIAISIPLVWLAWFSAKQYNHVSKLREDYAYKVAVAMAYHGYKDEAGQVDSEMSGKLLENIILHFADNPVRLYRNDNSASIIEALIRNNKVSEVVTAIRGDK
ncbi:hypothetical protein [Aeromonas sp. R10-1]|uniref:hypothetical protein n=1 Tax=Aeromonas sp. R10-1 TaxID=3138457 RepID=UPI0034A2DE7B